MRQYTPLSRIFCSSPVGIAESMRTAIKIELANAPMLDLVVSLTPAASLAFLDPLVAMAPIRAIRAGLDCDDPLAPVRQHLRGCGLRVVSSYRLHPALLAQLSLVLEIISA